MGSTAKVVTVIGATGRQGGSVARSLLQNSAFEVRCVTRRPGSLAALSLQGMGASIVPGDGLDEEGMEAILSGSWAVFINNSRDQSEAVQNGQYDLDLGNCILRSAATAGVKHVVFSSQPSAGDLTNGRIRIPVLDGSDPI